MTTVTRVLEVARTQLGYVEPGWGDRPGTQHTKFGDWYAAWSGRTAYRDTFWCAMFCSWCLAAAGFTPTQAGRYGNCNVWITWLKARGMWSTTPRVGDIVFFSWDGDRRAEHVGFVEAIRSDGRIQTLEGNASLPGKRDGVYRMIRSRRHIVGYGRPPYTTSVPKPATPGAMYGGNRKGYPTMPKGYGGPEDPAGRWWVAHWYKALAKHSPGYYKRISTDPAGAKEIERLEIGPRTLYIAREIGRKVIGTHQKWQWNGTITPLLWSIYPPVQ